MGEGGNGGCGYSLERGRKTAQRLPRTLAGEIAGNLSRKVDRHVAGLSNDSRTMADCTLKGNAMAEVSTTRTERDIMRHSLFGSGNSKKPYRNYYCVSVGSPDDLVIGHLVDLGLMKYGHVINDGKERYAIVTEAGAAEIDAKLPKEAVS